MSKPQVTITLGRSGQKVVKRSWPTSGTDFQGFSRRKRSLSDRFERDADTSMSSSSKRLQMKDNPRNSGSTRVKGVGEKDLRLKLIRKRMPSGVKNDVEEPTRMEIRQNMSCNSRVPKAAEFTLRNGSPTKREAEFLMMDPLRYSSRPLGNSIPQFPDRALHAVRRIPAPRNTDEELQVSSTMPVQASRIRRLSNSDVLDPSMSIGVAPIMRRVTSDAGKPLTELSGEQPLTVSSLLHFLGLGKYAINFLAEEPPLAKTRSEISNSRFLTPQPLALSIDSRQSQLSISGAASTSPRLSPARPSPLVSTLGLTDSLVTVCLFYSAFAPLVLAESPSH